ncbi:MAG: hypothetical protein QW076_04605 [Candidatus Anstonellales archaeon]
MKDKLEKEIRINNKDSIEPQIVDPDEEQILWHDISVNSKTADLSKVGGNEKNLIIEVSNDKKTMIISTENIDWNLKQLSKLDMIINELDSVSNNILEYIEENLIKFHNNVNSETYLDIIYLTINCKKQKLNSTKSFEFFNSYLKTNKLNYVLIKGKQLISSIIDNNSKQKIIQEFDKINQEIHEAIKEFEKVEKIVDEIEYLEHKSPIKNIDSLIARIRLLDKKMTELINTKLINTLIAKWYIFDIDLELTFKELYNSLSNFEKIDTQRKALISKLTCLKEKVRYNLFDELLTFVDTKRIFNQKISDKDIKIIYNELRENNFNLDIRTLKSLLEKLESIEILLNYGNKKVDENKDLNKVLESYIQALKNSKITKEAIKEILAHKKIKENFSSKTIEFVKNKLL